MRKLVLVAAVLSLGCAREKTPPADTSPAQASASGDRTSTTSTQRVAARQSRKTVLFVGTSLTAGYGLDPEDAYPVLIQGMIDSAGLPYRVVNAGVSGETSSGLLRRLDWLLQQQMDIVVIETGANDGLRGIPVETMQSNLQQIITRIRSAHPGASVALVQMEAMPNLGRGYTQRFREAFPTLAKRNEIALIPFLLENVAGHRELNQGDGIHPNEAGARIVALNVWKGLKPMLP